MRIFVVTALLLLAATVLATAEPLPTVPPGASANTELYGQYPLGYKAIITQWLQKRLIDPASAVTEFITEPKPTELPGKNGERLFGYLVEFRVNSRNQFGGYTGMQKHGALILNGEVIKSTGFGL